MQAPVVIKISGHELTDTAYLAEFATVVRDMKQPVVVVHGGGKEISSLQQKLGIEPKYIDGVRVTDTASLTIVEMVLCGTVNTRLVRHLVDAGVDALGMSGVDRGLIRASKMTHADIDMGFTGEVESVQGDLLLSTLEQGLVPVIAPICLGDAGSYNVNADHVAGAIGTTLKAERVIFLSNVDGVLIDGSIIHQLTSEAIQTAIDNGAIYGGMIPKVQTALQMINAGVSQVVITSLAGLKTHGGTAIIRS